MSSTASPPKVIPVVVVGVHRGTAIDTAAIFDVTPFYVAAVLDTTESPEKHQHSPQNLGTVLHVLHPRPRVLVTGTAVGNHVADARKVWDEYVDNMLKPEEGDDVKCIYIPLSDFHSGDGPPPPGTVEFMTGKLEDAFPKMLSASS